MGPSRSGARSPLLVGAVWVAALAAAAAQAWAYRHRFNPDGISYLDLADAWRAGRGLEVASGHWSPVYPAYLALALAVAPSSADELTVVHLANLAAFAAALGSLHLLLRTLLATRSERLGAPPSGWAAPPDGAFVAAGLAVGACVLLRTTSLRLVTPDLLLVTPVLLATAVLVRVVCGRGGAGSWAWLGGALGLGYLTKSVLFPTSVALLVAALVGARRGNRGKVALAALAFALVAAPQVARLSAARGALAFSDSSWLSVLWLQKGVPFVHWRGGPPEAGVPDRPPRVACEDPVVLEFAVPEGPWTYPLWGDPARWHAGADATTTAGTTLARAGRSLRQLWTVVESLLGVLAPLLLLFLVRGSRGGVAAVLSRQWPLVLPFLVAAALYAPFHVEDRFLGGVLTLVAVALLDGSALPAEALGPRGAGGAVVAGLLAATALVARPVVTESIDLLASPPPAEHEAARRALREAGVEAGDPVAVVGDGLRAYWARHARLRIVADVVPPDDGATAWGADPERRGCVAGGLAPLGVRVVVATLGEDGPSPPPPWRRLPGTSLAVLDLR